MTHSVEESQVHYSKRKNPDSKGGTLHNFIYTRAESKTLGTENRSVVSRDLGRRERLITNKGTKQRNFGVTELFCILIVVVDTRLNVLVKIHIGLHQKEQVLLFLNTFKKSTKMITSFPLSEYFSSMRKVSKNKALFRLKFKK